VTTAVMCGGDLAAGQQAARVEVVDQPVDRVLGAVERDSDLEDCRESVAQRHSALVGRAAVVVPCRRRRAGVYEQGGPPMVVCLPVLRSHTSEPAAGQPLGWIRTNPVEPGRRWLRSRQFAE
jgi:hypothetical protein